MGKEKLVGNGNKQKPGKSGKPTTAPKSDIQDKEGKAPKKEDTKNAGTVIFFIYQILLI